MAIWVIFSSKLRRLAIRDTSFWVVFSRLLCSSASFKGEILSLSPSVQLFFIHEARKVSTSNKGWLSNLSSILVYCCCNWIHPKLLVRSIPNKYKITWNCIRITYNELPSFKKNTEMMIHWCRSIAELDRSAAVHRWL